MLDEAPLISTPANDIADPPRVRTNYFEQIPYVQILNDRGETLLDLSCTDALNLAIRLTAEAGQGLNRSLARSRSMDGGDARPGRRLSPLDAHVHDLCEFRRRRSA